MTFIVEVAWFHIDEMDQFSEISWKLSWFGWKPPENHSFRFLQEQLVRRTA